MPTAVYGGLALLCVLIATFQAWREQYERAARAVTEAPTGPPSWDTDMARRRRIFAAAVSVLRATCGKMFKPRFGATIGLPGALWPFNDWDKLVERLGEVDRQTGRFRPHVEPSLFDGSDASFVSAAYDLLELYLWSSRTHPDFEAIRTAYSLPPADVITQLLDVTASPATADPLAPRDFHEEHGILWGTDQEGPGRPFCVGCYTASREWVPMSAVDSGPTHAKVRRFTCPHGHPQITLTWEQLTPTVGTTTVLRAVVPPWKPPEQ